MTARVRSAGDSDGLPSLGRSLLIGGLGFALVSLSVFATVAFAERWMYTHLGFLGAYLAWTALFILLGGGVLGSLVVGRWGLPRFYLLFGLAFFLYAAGWSAHTLPFVEPRANGLVRSQDLSSWVQSSLSRSAPRVPH